MREHPRPTKDSLPDLGVCERTWCGRESVDPFEQHMHSGEVVVHIDGQAPRCYCSAGCAGRALALYELRHDHPYPLLPPPPAPPAGPVLPSEIRAWARSHGYHVADRARIPGHIRDAYLKAHPEQARP